MDKSSVKKFAVNARIKLIDQITQKAFELGITPTEVIQPEWFQDGFLINGKYFKKYQIKQRQELVAKLQEKGFTEVIEETAYTWFNRLIAIRFMEVNEYLPVGVRVLSSEDSAKVEPDIIKAVLTIDLDLDLDLVYQLQDEEKVEELFKYLLVKQCNQLGKIMPVVFEAIADYTELLLPDHLLGEGSVVRDLVTQIDEADWKEQVEIIGWLYQYYISDKHEEIVGINKGAIQKEDIPAATQLFTPDWIVKYMVENSLGSLWLSAHPDPELKSKWQFYLPEETDVQMSFNPEDIKVFDPCMGSGHILVYAFDVLYDIYKSSGYPEKDIPRLILENNLYGLDIDERAAQLAYFAVLMKARSLNRRIFREPLKLNLCSIQESKAISKQDMLAAIPQLVKASLWTETVQSDVQYLFDIFTNAKEYGALIRVRLLDFIALEKLVESIKTSDQVENLFAASAKEDVLAVLPALIKQGHILSQRYDVVVTNPPYMGSRGMNTTLKKFINQHDGDYAADLFSVFIRRNCEFAKDTGYLGFMTPFVWMFIKSYEKLRQFIIDYKTLHSLVQLEYGAFEEAVVPICTFVLKNYSTNVPGIFIKLSDFKGAAVQPVKVLEAIQNPDVYYRYTAATKAFKLIPGSPIAYWAGERMRTAFAAGIPLGEAAWPKVGLFTCNNNLFLRFWYEVDQEKIGFNLPSRQEAAQSGMKWFPYNKGGEFRKWYGNRNYVVNFYRDGEEVSGYRANSGQSKSLPGAEFYFREGITWSFVSSSKFGVRYTPCGAVFDVGGSSVFTAKDDIYYFTALLSSKVAFQFLTLLNPTLNFQVGNVASLPVCYPKAALAKEQINQLAAESIAIAKTDWDSFETSWDFTKHPLLAYKEQVVTIEEAYRNWEAFTQSQFEKLKANEKNLNRFFIDIYSLNAELTSEVDDKEITIRKADRVREVKSFISYAVGCMFGRYSLDETGLVYAGGTFDLSRYKTFAVNADNVLPITDDEYFENDMVARFVEFVRITFGEQSLEENLDFIAETLSRKASETSRQAIRRYFVKEFYKDHVQIYQKRPIYWLFDSGRNDGFKVLVYMHRFDITTVAKVRTDYLHVLQRKYEAERVHLDLIMASDIAAHEKVQAKKQREKLSKQLTECGQYDQVIAYVANQKISIDLDNGVKENYAKFQVVEISQGEGKKRIKAKLFASN